MRMTCLTVTSTNPPILSHRRLLAALMLVFSFALSSTAAFQVATLTSPSSRMQTTATSTALHAWSLPTDGSLFSFSSTWYNEYNPTARATVYNDPSPVERFSFVALGNDWPSTVEETRQQQDAAAQPRERRGATNPLKRAWRRRVLRRILARRSSSSSS